MLGSGESENRGGASMGKTSNYYYDQLNKEQQRAYYAMKDGLLNLKDSFAVPMLSQKELSDIYFLIRMDCPEIFYSVTFTYKYYPDSTAVEMVPQYLFPKNKIKEHRQAMESRVKKLAHQAADLDEKGKELFIHDFIVENVKYDKLKKEYSHEIIGALGNGVAVCEGIAKAVKILCDVSLLILLVPIESVRLHYFLLDEILHHYVSEGLPGLPAVLVLSVLCIIRNYLCFKKSVISITINGKSFREEFIAESIPLIFLHEVC